MLKNYLQGISFLLNLQAAGLKFYLKTTLSQVFPFACGVVKNLIIEAFVYFYLLLFSLFFSIIITHLPLCFQLLGVPFF